jgi:hypothetical protein
MSCSSSGNSYIDSFSSIHSDGSMIIDESSFTFSLRSSFTSSSLVDSLTDSSDSDDDSSMYTVNSDNSLLQLCLITMRLSERAVKCHRSRIDWENHALILRHEKQFDCKYRMSYESFNKLVSTLHPALEQNNSKSMNSCAEPAISAPHILGLTIRWLSGSSFHDIRDAGNFSRPTFFRLLWKGISAVTNSKRLEMNLPRTFEALDELRRGFELKSTEEVMSGCIGALDGMLLLIRTPTRKEAMNVRQFFSGHYQRMGLNVQALVDSKLRFLYAGILKGGRSSDYKSYMQSRLMSWIESLPPWYFVAGDNAYVCTEHLLTPFMGSNRLNPDNDSYNFFLSQLRICVEMAFGRLVSKWRILRAPLEVPLSKCASVFQACCQLHNFCIDEMVNDSGEATRIETVYSNDDTIFGYIPSDVSNAPASGSILRQKLVQKIASKSLSRPELNIKRRTFEDQRRAIYYAPT